MKKVSLETAASASENLIGENNLADAEMQIKACKASRIIFTYPEKPGDFMEVTVIRPDEPDKRLKMVPGDSFDFKHTFNLKITRAITSDHPFPIEFTFMGEVYKLNKTKNNKLLLTK